MSVDGAVPCSLCQKDLLGRAVGLIDHFEMGIDWEAVGHPVHEGWTSDGHMHKFILLHEKCFEELIHELAKQELSTMLAMALGTIEDIRYGVGM